MRTEAVYAALDEGDRRLIVASGGASAADQDEQGADQSYGAGIDAGEVIDQSPGYQAELRTVRSHAS